MDCATFMSCLAELLGGAPAQAAARHARIEALREHARSCDACRGSEALVDLAARAAEGRDPVADPGPEYWQAFERSLASRLSAERRGLARRRAGWVAAAAAVAVAAVGAVFWSLRAPAPVPVAVAAPSPSPEAAPRIVAAPAPSPPPEQATVDPEDEAVVAGLEADAWGSWALAEDDDSSPAGLYPSVGDLDDESRRRLYDWLVEEEARIKQRGGRV